MGFSAAVDFVGEFAAADAAAGAAATAAGIGAADLAGGALAAGALGDAAGIASGAAGMDAALGAAAGGGAGDLAAGALASGGAADAAGIASGATGMDAALGAAAGGGAADLAAGALAGANALPGAPGSLPSLSGAAAADSAQFGVGASGGVANPAGGVVIGGAAPAGGSGALGGFTDFLKANKSLILPGALEAGSLAMKPKMPAYAGNLQALAHPSAAGTAAGDLATSLIPTVQTGNLPPGAQTAVSNATNDAVTSIKAKYAQMGMSGSTAEAQDIASAQARGQAMAFDMANQLTQTGLSAAGVSQQDLMNQENIYAMLMNQQIQNDQQLQQALASFASASALGAAVSPSHG